MDNMAATSGVASIRNCLRIMPLPWLNNRTNPSFAATSNRSCSASKEITVTTEVGEPGTPSNVNTARPDPARHMRISLASSAVATSWCKSHTAIATVGRWWSRSPVGRRIPCICGFEEPRTSCLLSLSKHMVVNVFSGCRPWCSWITSTNRCVRTSQMLTVLSIPRDKIWYSASLHMIFMEPFLMPCRLPTGLFTNADHSRISRSRPAVAKMLNWLLQSHVRIPLVCAGSDISSPYALCASSFHLIFLDSMSYRHRRESVPDETTAGPRSSTKPTCVTHAFGCAR
mmetsp:Transcript_53490/g.122051  ORF Transcript_53490/g.122051 Transcript_53490/m.122051 type:complete len:285 (-) Transcript_53490:126-980(-)